MTIIYKLAFLLLFQFFSSCNQAAKLPESSAQTDSLQIQKNDKVGTAHIIYKSIDGGQTWQDINEGLPQPVKEEGMGRTIFFADDNGLWLTAGKGLYHSKPTATGPFWGKETFPD